MRRLLLAASAVACVLASIGLQGQATRAAIRSPRLYVFDGGVLESDPARYHLTKEDVGVTQISVAAYLVVHPKGVLLWDTGAVGDDEWTPTGSAVVHKLTLPDGQPRQVTIRARLLPQLAEAGYKPSDVTHLALSHYHWDHTANANAFASATWLVRKVERDTMFANLPPGTYRRDTYAALRNATTVILKSKEHDVFGDGTVIIKSAPGHTVGHQILYVKLQQTGGVVLAGDLYHYAQERALNRFPTFEFSEQQTRASRQDVDAFLKKTGAQLWIQHDLTAHTARKKSPAYYE